MKPVNQNQPASHKLLIGPRIRRLRQSLGLTQKTMAEELQISTSYMNLIERNQRPVSAALLLRLSSIYDIDLASFSPETDAKLQKDIENILKSPVLKNHNIPSSELRDVIGASPDFARAFISLYERTESLMVQARLRDDPLANRLKAELLEEGAGAVEAVRKFIHDNDNYFDLLDIAAENFANELGLGESKPHTALTDRLWDSHKIRVRIVPEDIIKGQFAYYDPHQRRLSLSELLPQSGRRFRLAYQLALLEAGALIDNIIAKALLPSKEADQLARLSLANYFAAATLMPYKRFLLAAQENQYDVELLTRRFDTSYEQTAHRLTTLQRPGMRGVPFFFVRVDMAGNVSKRFSAGRFHFSRFGGACPLWNIHACFQTPGATLPQIIEMEDGTEYFSVARAILRPEQRHGGQARMLAIGLGCEMKYANKLIYAKKAIGLSPVPIGVNCYLCQRPACSARAHAPINKRLKFDERSLSRSIFRFEEK